MKLHPPQQEIAKKALGLCLALIGSKHLWAPEWTEKEIRVAQAVLAQLEAPDMQEDPTDA